MKKWIMSFVIFIVTLIILIGLYFSPIGSYFLKNYVKDKIYFIKNFKITYFNHSINSFSMTMNNKNGIIQVFGTILPFNISYNANFNNVKVVFPLLKGVMSSTGEIVQEKKFIKLTGNYIYSKGYGDLNLSFQRNNIKGLITGKNFDTKVLLKNIKNFHFPIFKNIPISGYNNLVFKITDKPVLWSDFQGNLNINNIIIPITSKLKINFFNNENFVFNLNVNSSKIIGKIKGIKNNNSLIINGLLNRFDLNLIKKSVLVPVKGIVTLRFKYNNQSDIFTFFSTYFNGYSDGDNINIQINMPLKRFFKFLKIPPILSGKISGNIIINNNKGYFNLLIENATFIPNKIIKKLDSITHIKLEKIKSTFFLNGSFDNKKIIFDFISKNQNYYMYLSKGIYYYEGFYNFDFDLKIDDNNLYKFNITNGQIKLLQHNINKLGYDILVD